MEKPFGRVYGLPTEAEWEYACRAGRHSTFHYGNSLSSTQANFNGQHPYGGASRGPYLRRTTSVGSYASNDFGIFDMHGNILEWCADWYNDTYYRIGQKVDPEGPQTGTFRVLRGGCYESTGGGCRAASRGHNVPFNRNDFYGFRVVCRFVN
jgi:formylglycine-generating enzyme required for sulfatase activity